MHYPNAFLAAVQLHAAVNQINISAEDWQYIRVAAHQARTEHAILEVVQRLGVAFPVKFKPVPRLSQQTVVIYSPLGKDYRVGLHVADDTREVGHLYSGDPSLGLNLRSFAIGVDLNQAGRAALPQRGYLEITNSPATGFQLSFLNGSHFNPVDQPVADALRHFIRGALNAQLFNAKSREQMLMLSLAIQTLS